MPRPARLPARAGVLEMAAPLVVSFWMRAAVTFVDTIYATRYGDAAVAAIGLTIPLEFLMIAIWVGLSSGLTSNLSRAMGAGEPAKVEQYLAVARRLVTLTAPLFVLVGATIWFVAPRLALTPDVARGFQVYGTVLIAGSALTTFWSVIPDSLVKAHQDTRSTMWAGIWTNLINVGLNTWFVFGLDWGLVGIAISTVLGRLGGLSYALVQAERHERRRRGEEGDRSSLDAAPRWAVLRLAVPASLTFSLMAAENALVNGLLAGTEHATESIAAYSIYYRIVLFALQPVIATGVAMLPFAAHRLGSGDVLGARAGLLQAWRASVLYALLVVAPTMLLIGRGLAAWLAESPLTARYTSFALYCVPLACLTNAPFLLCRPLFEAMQRGRPGLVLALTRYLVLAPPAAWTGIHAARLFDLPSVYGLIAALAAVELLASTLFLAWTARALRALAADTPRFAP